MLTRVGQTFYGDDVRVDEHINQDAIASDYASETAAVVSMEPARRARRVNDLSRWVGSVLPSIREFLELPKGWDSYQGQPLRHETGMFALQILYDLMSPRLPIPQVVPAPSGGLQFEWHQNDLDIELYVGAPYECEFHYHDHVTGEEDNIALTSDFSPLNRWMARLQEPPRVAVNA
jgi:hypothetical protein